MYFKTLNSKKNPFLTIENIKTKARGRAYYKLSASHESIGPEFESKQVIWI